ncbi:MAG: serine O-acetyltransferase, partial [Negativicutes bacterium]|nr:serine O-acetyltransferase [Negativicutes bacterium]
MLKTLKRDIEAVFARDPAARTVWEVLLCYPGLHAIWLHRLAHALYRRG